MVVPAASGDPVEQRNAFRQLRELQQQIQQQIEEPGITLDTLSMGMSADMTAAISEGSTIVRIGSAIFGKRNYD
jgi:hypothetical protein